MGGFVALAFYFVRIAGYHYLDMKHQLSISGSIFTVVIAILAYVLVSTTPDEVGPVGIAIFFLLVFIAFFVLFDFLWRVITKSRRQKIYNLYLIAIIAGIPTMLLGLQSLGQLEIRDIAVVVVLASVLIFYLAKRQQG